ncbi:MAG: NUDIX hydrolase [Desulfurococcales archaeon]|nr:NUDIX hydrolase [Desulfurococcales archaeon]
MKVECRGRRVVFRASLEELPNGRRVVVDRVEFPSSVAVLPVRGCEVLLVRQYRPTLGEWTLEAPAGTIKEGESPEEAAGRELAEEAGFRPGRLVKVGEGYVSPGYSTEYMYLYIAEDLAPAGAEPEYYEVLEPPVWMNVDEAMERVRDVKTLLLLYAVKARGCSG